MGPDRQRSRAHPSRHGSSITVGILYALVHVWALWNYGATQEKVLNGLFLLSLPVVVFFALTVRRGFLCTPRIAALILVGAYLFTQSALQPTLTGRGYIQAACAWSALFLALGLAAEARRSQRAIWLFLVGAGALQAAFGLAQALDVVGDSAAVTQLAGAHGTLVNRNHFAALLNLSLPLAVGMVYVRVSQRSTDRSGEAAAFVWIALLSLSLMGVAVLLSLSRAGSAILVLTLASMALLLTLRRRTSDGRTLSAKAAWLLLVLVLLIGSMVGIGPLLDRFGFRDFDSGGRIQVYRDTGALILDHPIQGVGPGMYRWRFRPYQTQNGRLLYHHAHNDYLEVAAEWGLPVALMFWALLVYRMIRAARIFLRSESTWKQGLALGCAGAIFSILLHSLVDFSLQIPSVAATFFMIVALSWSLEDSFSTSLDRALS